VPPRVHLRVPGPHTIGLYMPCATAQFIGVKVVHLMPERYPSVEAEVFLYAAETGRLLFWGDGKPLTARRTAAVSAAASLRLQPVCNSLVVFGAGVQAAAHLAAFAGAYPGLERIWAVTRSPASLRRLEGMLPEGLPARLRPCDDLSRRLGEAGIVIAATPAPAPLFAGSDLAPGCHVVGIGSATYQMNELPPEVFLDGAVWVDTRDALAEAGDFQAARRAGWEEDSLRGDLFDLLGPGAPPPLPGGPERPRTVFKSVGQAAQDLAILIRLWELLGRPEAGP